MSYAIVKGIKIDEKKGEVFMKSASNNVTPRDYYWEQYPSLNKILKEEGIEALKIIILEEYISGNFQAGTKNKYHWAFISLLHNPLFQKFDWRGYGFNVEKGSDYYKKENREEYIALLKEVLEKEIPKDKYVITKETYHGDQVYGKRTKNFMRWYREKSKATKYKFREMAESIKKGFYGSENWEIVGL